MKLLLGIIFLVIFSLQVIPVRGMGKIFGKTQVSNDIQDDDDSGNDQPPGKLLKFGDGLIVFYTSSDPVVHVRAFKKELSSFSYKADALPAFFVAEIPCPPPNF